MTAPCKDCPDRHYKCHSECERYKEFRKQCDDVRKQMHLDSLGRKIEIDRAIKRQEYHRKRQHTDKKY